MLQQIWHVRGGVHIESLEARKLFTTSVNVDLGAVQSVLSGTTQYQPAMNYNGNFGVLVTATPGSTGSVGDAINATILDATGKPVGSPIVVNSSMLPLDDHPDVAVAADGSFVVVWTSTTTIYFSNSTAPGLQRATQPLSLDRRWPTTLQWPLPPTAASS